jgi:hypothetical protein
MRVYQPHLRTIEIWIAGYPSYYEECPKNVETTQRDPEIDA